MPRLIFCGSRDWTDREMIRAAVRRCIEQFGPFELIHGGKNSIGSGELANLDHGTDRCAAAEVLARHWTGSDLGGSLQRKRDPATYRSDRKPFW